ncbi:ensconsin-like isoform X2 [Limulus polyphemus]|uniref:Ensconsin-like isoform X2 n=1 Tax=Limulus polyphemus TaxID=6850 RepID=A0ABM1RXC1_LIMPO|nr:ensconsin-like isoform X2 [Limulus polyphemus]
MYWFAHAADPPQDKPRRGLWSQSPDQQDPENESLSHTVPQQGVQSPTKQHDIKSPSEPQTPGTLADGKEASSPLTLKEREEKARYIREKQAEERLRRFNEIKQQQMNAQHLREQQEEERRRKIEEFRQRDQERRNAVEERKRQIWEAEQERKEALLRRNLDRESKLEARRYAQRSSSSFVFGSSTPRTLDLDVGILGGRSSSILFAASGGRRSEERDVDGSKKRATSACSLDRRPEGNDDYMDETGGSEPQVKLREPNVDSSALQDRTFKRRSYGGLASEEIKACLTMTDGNTTFLASPDAGSGDPFLDLHSSGWLIGSGVMVGE